MDKIKPIFTATATAVGGRNGHSETSDGSVKAYLSVPKEMGGLVSLVQQHRNISLQQVMLPVLVVRSTLLPRNTKKLPQMQRSRVQFRLVCVKAVALHLP